MFAGADMGRKSSYGNHKLTAAKSKPPWSALPDSHCAKMSILNVE
jgi:hypothetical protein